MFILPLISNDIENYIDYIGIDGISTSNTKPFVNGYSSDINRPWLDTCIFLMFDSGKINLVNVNLLKDKNSFRIKYDISIDKKFYTVFVFDILYEYERDFSIILRGEYNDISKKAKERISSFWSLSKENAIYRSMYSESYKMIGCAHDRIKEVDYMEDVSESIYNQYYE